jgi:hypothetical protein
VSWSRAAGTKLALLAPEARRSYGRFAVWRRLLRFAVNATGALWVAVVVAAVAATSASANWNEPAAGPLNLDPTRDGFDPSIATVAGVPYIAWSESNGTNDEIRIKQLTGGVWTAIGGSPNVDATQSAFIPDITSIGGVPYVAWEESNGTNDEIHVAQFNGSSWVAVGGALNVNPTENAGVPRITSIGGVPYVAWGEFNGTNDEVHVAQFNGSSWVAVGGALNVDTTKGAFLSSIAAIAGVPYVAWEESNGTNDEVHVAQFNGSSWVAIGGALNVDTMKGAFFPSIAAIGGVPYVAWYENNGTNYEIHVARFNGSSWVHLGDALNVDTTKNAFDPSITSIGGVPLVDWYESNGTNNEIHVAQFNGSSWIAVGGALNVDPSKNAFFTDPPNITAIGGVPYAAWTETNGTNFQIRVKRLEPDFLAESATPSSTGATLSAQVNDFGVPLPVGFELGTTPSFGTQTPLETSPGAGVSTLTQAVAGLLPSTLYDWRAFGSDTFRETSVSPTQSFTTLAAPSPLLPIVPLALPKLVLLGAPIASPSGVRFSLVCQAAVGVVCQGVAQLTTLEKLLGKRVTALSARREKRHSKRVVIGSTSFSLPAGQSDNIKVPLNSTGRKLLARFRRVPASLQIRLLNTNPPTVLSVKTTIESKKKKKRKHRR